MIDQETGKPLKVWGGAESPPNIILPVAQVKQLQAVLDREGIRYELDENYYSIDGKPEITFVNLARGTDPVRIQRLLDDVDVSDAAVRKFPAP